MNVPFIDLKRYEDSFHRRLMDKFHVMTANSQFIGGAEIGILESTLQNRLDVKNAITCANGTDALQLALRALGVGPGDKVVVPNVTFWATFEAVVNVGATPITVDVDLSDGGVDYDAMHEAIAKAAPKAAIIAHLYGWGTARLEEIRKLCAGNGVLLVEDGAQSFGATYEGNPIYKGALISTTSFYPAKVLGAAGDGGAVFTDDSVLADKVRMLGNHGRTAHYGYGDVGWNSRLDALQAAFLNLSIDYIDSRIESRRRSAAIYQKRLKEIGIEVMLPPVSYVENGYCNVCMIWDAGLKTQLESTLRASGVGYGNIYPGVMSKQLGAAPYLGAHFGGSNGDKLSSSVLNLPLFPYMTNDEIGFVVDTISNVLDNGGA